MVAPRKGVRLGVLCVSILRLLDRRPAGFVSGELGGTTRNPLVYSRITSIGERITINIRVKRKPVRTWEDRLIVAYTSEFTQTLPRSSNGRIDTIKDLCGLERGVGGNP